MVYKWYIRWSALQGHRTRHVSTMTRLIKCPQGLLDKLHHCAYCTTRPVCVPGITWTCSIPLLQPQLLRFFSTSTTASAFYRHLCFPPPPLLSTQPASPSCPLSPGLIQCSCRLRERLYRSVSWLGFRTPSPSQVCQSKHGTSPLFGDRLLGEPEGLVDGLHPHRHYAPSAIRVQWVSAAKLNGETTILAGSLTSLHVANVVHCMPDPVFSPIPQRVGESESVSTS